MQHNLISLFSKHKAVSKILSCCAVLVFVFVSCGPIVKAHATGVSVPQPFFPITPWSAGNVSGNYDDLTDEQKEIADYIIGSGAAQYGGMSNYWLRSAYDASDSVESWFKSIGGNVLTTIYNAASVLVTAPQLVVSYIGSAIYKASQYNSYSDFKTDVDNADHVYMPYVPGLSSAWFDFFGAYGSLYDWQFSATELNPAGFAFTYNTMSMNNSFQLQYNQYLLELALPHVRANYPSGYQANDIFSHSFFQTYHNVFVNTTNNSIYLCDDYGNKAYDDFYSDFLYYGYYGSGGIYKSTTHLKTAAYASNSYNSVLEIYNAISNGNMRFVRDYYGYTEYYFAYADFITGLYIGDTWANKRPWAIDNDLNLGLPASLTNIDEVEKDVLVDIKGLVQDLVDGLTDLKQAVVDNAVVKDDVSELVTKVIYTTDRVRTSPDVTIPIDVFKPVFGENQDGYIWYLWNMTKPLVLYTRDLLNTLLFNGNGIAWIVYGVIAIGLIGGLVVKFLL